MAKPSGPSSGRLSHSWVIGPGAPSAPIGIVHSRPEVGLPAPAPPSLCIASSSVVPSAISCSPVAPNWLPSSRASLSHRSGVPPPGGTRQSTGCS